jgi:hypothetical protein
MPRKKRDVKRKLISKFHFEERPGSKHECLSLVIDGKKYATTRFSRGHSEITDGVLTEISKQLFVYNLGFLKEMLDCTKSRSDYLNRWNQNKHLRRY